MSDSPMKCDDVERFVHPYVDGEFDEAERAQLERHVDGCAACRDLVAFQSTFKANLKTRLRRPAAPAELRGRVLAALDAADAAGDGPVRPLWRRAAPATAVVAVAASVVVFLGVFH